MAEAQKIPTRIAAGVHTPEELGVKWLVQGRSEEWGRGTVVSISTDTQGRALWA